MNLPSSAAVIGYGRMGKSHARVIADLDIYLDSVVDPNLTGKNFLDQSEQVLPVKAYSNLENLFENHVPELLVISATAEKRANQVLSAIEAGVRIILVEKPVATSLLQCKMIQDACSQRRVRLAVNNK
jgi:predicted dehydrogenase